MTNGVNSEDLFQWLGSYRNIATNCMPDTAIMACSNEVVSL